MIFTKAALAAAPDIEYLYPSGGQQGTTVTVTAGNKGGSKITPWPVKFWSDCEGLEFKAGEKIGNFTVAIAKDVAPGPHLVRLFNDEGASQPRLFIVGRHPEVIEKEPNDDLAKAQVIKDIPTVVNGVLDKPGDVDFYTVDLEAGKWFVAELECRRLGSPTDPAMHLLDKDGTDVAFNHDTYGLDPLIAYRPSKAGRYFVQVVGFPYPPGSDIKFVGSKTTVYRLNLTTGPYARFAMPPTAPRDRKSTVKLYGWNLGASANSAPFDTAVEVEVNPSSVTAGQNQMFFAPPQIDNIIRLPLISATPQVKTEACRTPEHAKSLTIPAVIAGTIDAPRGSDCYAFDASKGEVVTLVVKAMSLNSPLDPMLVITDASGKEINREVGAGSDIRLDFSAPDDGRFVTSLSDFKNAGGRDYFYQLEISRKAGDFSAKVDAPTYRIEKGKSVKVQVSVAKIGAAPKNLKLEIPELPEGVTASIPPVPAKSGAVTVMLNAAADAKAANVPFKIILRDPDSEVAAVRIAGFEVADNALGVRTDTLWLTVGNLPGGAITEKKKKKKK